MRVSRRASMASMSKQHCKEDLTCKQICECCSRFKKEMEVRINTYMNKYEKATKEIVFLT